MTTIVLIRHAQAGVAAGDFLRPLTDTGLRQAADVGFWLRNIGFEAQAAIVSGSTRTVETYRQLGQSLVAKPHDAAYNASSATLANLVRELGNDVEFVIVVAHNPGISDLAWQCGHTSSLHPGSAVVIVSPGPPEGFEPTAGQVRATYEASI